jgi:hypothetical protein
MLDSQCHVTTAKECSLLDIIFLDSLTKTLVKGLKYRYSITTDLLEPMLIMALAGGPMKTIPACASLSANAAFSLRNPYLWH